MALRGLRTWLAIALLAALLVPPAGAAATTSEPKPAAQISSQPSRGPRYYPEFTYERLYVEMRDGVELAVDLWRPVTPKGVEVPVILTLSPYRVLNRALDVNETDLPNEDARLFVPKGYAYARADVRGTYGSGGCWDYGGIKERHDGYDLVEWFGTRAWSNGKVAMTGGSYDGTTANAAAVERPPHLATIVPVSAISRWWGYAYQQGTRSTYSGESADIDPPSDTPTDFMFGYGFLPPPNPSDLSRPDQIAMRWDVCDRDEKFLKGYSTEPDYDEFWLERDYLRKAHKVDVPVLVAHGLLDFNVKTWEGTAWFQDLNTEKILVAGQWPHSNPRTYWAGWNLLLEKWFERWLYGVRNGVENEPAVQVQSSDGQWYTGERWGEGKKRTFALGEGEASFFDDGALTESEMLRGPVNDRFVRVDLEDAKDLRLQGRPILHLRASSDSSSTHLVAVLADVAPNGGLRVISRAFMNARYRESLRKGEDLEPGRAYDFRLEFIDKDFVVADDHHLALFIASSSNTWVAPDENRASNTIDLSRSRLELRLERNP
jgi:X-Pro dipeptidyl-peptidase